ncbi:MAG: hypothetical protein NTV68_08730 [Methanomicrobiales archaeon]|nr:hypothetical protein [Methanomicrobiales archaeon]
MKDIHFLSSFIERNLIKNTITYSRYGSEEAAERLHSRGGEF